MKRLHRELREIISDIDYALWSLGKGPIKDEDYPVNIPDAIRFIQAAKRDLINIIIK